MNTELLTRIFGRDQQWYGPCTIIVNAEAGVQSLGVDSIIGGGAKSYAPRMISGRICADTVCLSEDHSALLIVQTYKIKQSTGVEVVKQTLIVADSGQVVAIEFPDTAPLAQLGLAPPSPRPQAGSHPGTQSRPF